MKKNIKIGLIGFGTVGTGVVKILLGSAKPFLRGRNFNLELVKIADLDTKRDRGIKIPDGMLVNDTAYILNNPEIDIVVELMGGYEPARAFTLKALESGKSVVTANKALIAKYGRELFRAAEKTGASYMFEASVGGGIPIIRGIANGLNANEMQNIYGILNGTTNFILTGMARDGFTYGKVLSKAQELGYAEADPTADVSGKDTLNKLAILARLSFGADLDIDKVYCEGIENITLDDINYAWELGYVIKLLAIAKRHGDGRVEARVHPTLVDTESIMAYVEDEFNAVEIHGDAVGRQVFYGKGAGMFPTASAVVSDIVDVASCIQSGTQTNISKIMVDTDGPGIVDISELMLTYYLRFNVKDRPGVLAQISNVFADRNISIQSVIQYGKSSRDSVPLVIMTHEACEGDMQKAMKAFSKFDNIKGRVQLIRVENL